MRSRSLLNLFNALGLSALLVVGFCVSAIAEGVQSFPTYDSETAERYSSLAREGYNARSDGDLATTVAKFTEQAELIEGAAGGYYNLAFAQSLSGNVEAGIAALQKAVDNGWDRLDYVLEDTDLDALRGDPAFAGIIAKTKANIAAGDLVLGKGLPEYKNSPRTFSDKEELEEWADEQSSKIKANSRVWSSWQYTAARLDLSAQRLAALRELTEGDATFDYGLERVRVYTKVSSIRDCWGALGGAAIGEAKAYLAGSPSGVGAAEARYIAGFASSLSVCDSESPEMAKAIQVAHGYFTQVEKGTEYYGAAQSWLAYHELEAAGDNPEKVYPLIKKVVSEFGADKKAGRVIGVKFPDVAVKASWPIAIKLKDIDGKTVTLEEYKGKVLLIDFWATWCGPCRQELPNVKRVYSKYHGKGLEILSVSLDNGEKTSQDDYRKWITENEMTWRHIYDEKYWDAELSNRFYVNGIPAAFLIGRDGSLVALGEECYGEALEAAVENAIAMN